MEKERIYNPLFGIKMQFGYDGYDELLPLSFQQEHIIESMMFKKCVDPRYEAMLLEKADLCDMDEEYNGEAEEMTQDELDSLKSNILESLTVKYGTPKAQMAKLRSAIVKASGLDTAGTDSLKIIGGTNEPIPEENWFKFAKPKKIGGHPTVTGEMLLPDYQSIFIVFHPTNLDPTYKMGAADMVVSYRWFLNKAEITDLVEDPTGATQTAGQIAKIVGKIVKANSPKFLSKAADIKKKKVAIDALKAEIAALGKEEAQLDSGLASAQTMFDSQYPKRIADKTAELNNLKDQNAALEAQIAALKSDAESAKRGEGDAVKMNTEPVQNANQEDTKVKEWRDKLEQGLTAKGFNEDVNDTVWRREYGNFSEKNIQVNINFWLEGKFEVEVLTGRGGGMPSPVVKATSKKSAGLPALVNKVFKAVDKILGKEAKADPDTEGTQEQVKNPNAPDNSKVSTADTGTGKADNAAYAEAARNTADMITVMLASHGYATKGVSLTAGGGVSCKWASKQSAKKYIQLSWTPDKGFTLTDNRVPTDGTKKYTAATADELKTIFNEKVMANMVDETPAASAEQAKAEGQPAANADAGEAGKMLDAMKLPHTPENIEIEQLRLNFVKELANRGLGLVKTDKARPNCGVYERNLDKSSNPLGGVIRVSLDLWGFSDSGTGKNKKFDTSGECDISAYVVRDGDQVDEKDLQSEDVSGIPQMTKDALAHIDQIIARYFGENPNPEKPATATPEPTPANQEGVKPYEIRPSGAGDDPEILSVKSEPQSVRGKVTAGNWAVEYETVSPLGGTGKKTFDKYFFKKQEALDWIAKTQAEIKVKQDAEKTATTPQADTGAGEPEGVKTLNDILAGKMDTMKLKPIIEKALDELEASGLDKQYNDLIDRAIDYNTALLKKKAA